MMPTSSSLAAPEVVMTTTSGAANDDKKLASLQLSTFSNITIINDLVNRYRLFVTNSSSPKSYHLPNDTDARLIIIDFEFSIISRAVLAQFENSQFNT